MKKTLISMIAVFAVSGSAFAVPSLSTQREDCESKSDFVWVEKSQTCVPINACTDRNPYWSSWYCKTGFSDSGNLNLVFDKLMEELDGSRVIETKKLSSVNRYDYYGLKTSNGGYLVVEVQPQFYLGAAANALLAYGYAYEISGNTDNKGRWIVESPILVKYEQCKEIAGFASSLMGQTVDYEAVDRDGEEVCSLLVVDGEY